MKKEKFDNSGVGQLYTDGIPPHIEKDARLFPQGGSDRVLLRDKFQEAIPFYLRENKPVILRKPNEQMFKDAMTEARARFEQKLKDEKDMN